MTKKSIIEWHDLNLDPNDIPGMEQKVIVTVESLDGDSTRIFDELCSYDEERNMWWFINPDRQTGYWEREALWNKVVGWAELPDDPMPVYGNFVCT